ncbi:MAG: DUF6883 domain-containing protein [Cyanobacteria bacterium P01_H01_bin.121]
MKLPNPEQAVIPFEKLEGYSLNSNHSEGCHEAIVFRSALGLSIESANELRTALRAALQTGTAIEVQRNAFGQKYQLDFAMTRNNSTAIIRSVRIVRNNEDFPRLITCYVL